MSKNAKNGILFLLAVILWAPLTLWGGYVLSIMWGWFIIPVFKLPALSVGYAAGFLCVWRYIRGWHKADVVAKASDEFDYSILSLCISFFGPLLFLGTGWLIKTFFI